ncbi:MAG: NirD/YgiW/YdeI family stress tolerance protein [Alistipes senegalensis]|nr:NirD/YgiW/YdeI family stress tolerance protein [Oxalobacter formigenes]MCM1281539.1 NirD/YgiW/YdeI family stress tolerance protein [Alistipes senegalensis]
MFFYLFSPPAKNTFTPSANPSGKVKRMEPEQEKTVKSLLEKPPYGEIFRLTGKIEAFLGGNRYLFSDGTGRIAIRISLRVFGETSLFKTSRIAIRGDLKQTHSGHPILRTRRLRVLYY